MAHGVVIWKKNLKIPFSLFALPMLFSSNLPITNINNEQQNLEGKDSENDQLEG